MGASISIYWPGITEEDLDNDFGFQNDDKAWASWIAQIESQSGLKKLLESLGLGALSTHTTQGMKERDVRWVSPAELAAAAERLIGLIDSTDDRIEPLLAAYELDANGIEPAGAELRLDLEDLILRTKHPRELDIPRVTLSIDW